MLAFPSLQHMRNSAPLRRAGPASGRPGQGQAWPRCRRAWPGGRGHRGGSPSRNPSLARVVGLLHRGRIVVALGRATDVKSHRRPQSAPGPRSKSAPVSFKPEGLPAAVFATRKYQSLAVGRNLHRKLLAACRLVRNQARLGQRGRDGLEDIRQLGHRDWPSQSMLAGRIRRIELARVRGDRLHGRAGGIFWRISAFRAAAAGAAGRSRRRHSATE